MSNTPVVILGARVIDGRPSRVLAARLATALTLWQSDPTQPVVVSGDGEAMVMADWLSARGVPTEALVLEEHARSTNENLEYSRALFPAAERLLVVTNRFHVLRTRVWAWHLGIPITIVAAPTPLRSMVKNYAREVVALPHSAARVAWRRVVKILHGQ